MVKFAFRSLQLVELGASFPIEIAAMLPFRSLGSGVNNKMHTDEAKEAM